MELRLILIRHGLTPWNYEFRYQGHTDIELSSDGIEQARALQKRLSDNKLEAIYCSDLKRALETARIISEPHKLEIKTDQRLREINFGVWEGLVYKEIEQMYPELLRTWLEAPHLLEVPQGETFEKLQIRVMACTKDIIAAHSSGNVAIVAHGGVIAALTCGLLNEPLARMWQYKQKNAAVNVLKIEGNTVEVELFNDTSHLDLF